jgi:protein arginine kinase activator
MPEEPSSKIPERPLECTECRKPIAVRYTEIVGDTISNTSMCSDCPELRKKLFGSYYGDVGGVGEGLAGLACGSCGTTLEAVRTGNPLGCHVCYEVFGEVILSELQTASKIGLRLVNAKKSTPVHIGRSPGETLEINPSMRLLALNEALNETLKREDYEQAAWLRDQIKALTHEERPEKEKKSKNKKNEK